MGMILRIASSRIVGQGDIVGRSGYFSLNLSANSVMRGRLDARRTLKSLVADLRVKKYMNRDSSSPYLFPFLESREGTKEAYREYQLALRSFNQQLMLLGELLGLGDKLSSYAGKHNAFAI